jgi:hypothetical protein
MHTGESWGEEGEVGEERSEESPNISFHIISNRCALKTPLVVVLSEQLLAELDVLGLGTRIC